METMTFDEYYGRLPSSTLRLVKKYNVSPADFDFILDQFMGTVQDGWSWVESHIRENSTAGYYQPKFF
jgi:hypothetical protein